MKRIYWKIWGLIMDLFFVKERMTIYGGSHYKADVMLRTVKGNDGLWWSGYYYVSDNGAVSYGRGSTECGCNDYHRSRAIAYKHVKESYITSEIEWENWMNNIK